MNQPKFRGSTIGRGHTLTIIPMYFISSSTLYFRTQQNEGRGEFQRSHDLPIHESGFLFFPDCNFCELGGPRTTQSEFFAIACKGMLAAKALNFSSQRIRPVICMTTKSVKMEPIVMARPVKPLKKKAYEKSTK